MLVHNAHACGGNTLYCTPPPLSLSAGESIRFRRQHVRPSAGRTGSWMVRFVNIQPVTPPGFVSCQPYLAVSVRRYIKSLISRLQ